MKTSAWVALLLGTSLFLGLVLWQGADSIAAAFRTAGWRLLLLPLFYPPYLALRLLSLRLFYRPGRAPRFGPLVWAMWIGQSINALLPVATIGGDLVKARHLAARGTPAPDSAAALVVDKAAQVLGLALMALGGVALLLHLRAEAQIVRVAGAGVLLLLVGVGGFVLVQRGGLFGFLLGSLTRVTGRGHSLSASARSTDEIIRELHGRPLRILLGALLHLACELVLSFEVFFAARLIGHPIGLEAAVMLKALTGIVRAAGFVLPAGLGLLEGGFIALGALIDLPASAMLSVSLATRVRELCSGVPGILAWQHGEGRSLLARRD